MKTADKEFLGIMSYHVGLLLLLFRVDQKSSTGHGCHVTVFAAHIDVYGTIVELVAIAIVLELMHCDVVTGLDHDWSEILEEVEADAWVVRDELSYCA